MQDPFLMHTQNAAELFLIRHGDAIPGADELIPGGRYDNLPLSQIGRKQALALAERLKKIHFDAAYSSPLKRCQETGAPLLEHLGLQAQLVDGLREINLDELVPIAEHNNPQEIVKALQERQDDIVRIAGESGTWDSFPNSERSKDFRRRVVTTIDEIAARHIGQRVLLFAHGGVINAYAAEVLQLDKEFFFPCVNTSITIVRVNQQRRVLYIMNDIAHLRIF
uniref:Phosphoglycerate mutase n=1 Tax=Thermosporothrix sp. COM3 TaxID=2490863 RepID=A0A455SKH4_9CHLR|nr:phosphoglycerate mutase [Thermosporothrix sp. COM3]